MPKHHHIIDANGLTLGRLASRIAMLLRGKDRVDFTPHLDPETTIKITNASRVSFSGLKFDHKTYVRHSGYPGGQKTVTARQLAVTKGYGELIKKAVRGMLPPNRTRAKLLKRLIIEE